MEYSINNLSKLAGISTRTLRYYDEIDIKTVLLQTDIYKADDMYYLIWDEY